MEKAPIGVFVNPDDELRTPVLPCSEAVVTDPRAKPRGGERNEA